MRYSISYVKCDRCKTVFEDKGEPMCTPMWMKFQSFNGKRFFGEGDREYHLCIDCEREFIDWFCEEDVKRK